MGQAIGSMDLYFGDTRVEGQITAWAPKSYRMYYLNPGGWWTTVRHTVDAADGTIRLRLTRNQTYYDEQLALQRTQKTPFALWYHGTPIIQEPPYEFIGAPFVHNSIQAIEVAPFAVPPVTRQKGQLILDAGVSSPTLAAAVAEFNERRFSESLASLARVTEPDAQIGKAVLCLYLAGRPEVEREVQLVPEAIQILQAYLREHPEACILAEHLRDAECFVKGLDFHLNRGRMCEVDGQLVQRVHFIENDKAIGQWLLIRADSPLYWKAQIRLGRARGPAPDPGRSSPDIAYDRDASRLVAKIHNVGAVEASKVKVVFYAGNPDIGGEKIGETLIERIETPNDLEPRIETASIPWKPAADETEVLVVIDPDDTVPNEITTFNNRAFLPDSSRALGAGQTCHGIRLVAAGRRPAASHPEPVLLVRVPYLRQDPARARNRFRRFTRDHRRLHARRGLDRHGAGRRSVGSVPASSQSRQPGSVHAGRTMARDGGADRDDPRQRRGPRVAQGADDGLRPGGLRKRGRPATR